MGRYFKNQKSDQYRQQSKKKKQKQFTYPTTTSFKDSPVCWRGGAVVYTDCISAEG